MKDLGEGKLDYEGSILDTYKKDWNTFVEYNIKDVLLIVKLEAKCLLFNLIVEFCYDCVSTIDNVMMTVPTNEGYIIKYLHNNNMVMNDRPTDLEDWWRDEKCYIVRDKNGNEYGWGVARYMTPESFFRFPVIMFIRVDFPDPLGPRSA